MNVKSRLQAAVCRRGMQEAGARNRKGDRERLIQIVLSAFGNLSAVDQKDLIAKMRKKAKPGSKK